MNAVDWAIVIFCLLGARAGYRRGAILSLAGLAGYIVAGLCAYWFAGPLSEYLLTETSMGAAISDWLGGESLSFPDWSWTVPGLGGAFLLSRPRPWAEVVLYGIAFLAIFMGVVFLSRRAAFLVTRGMGGTIFGALNCWAGLLLGLGEAFLLVSLAVIILPPLLSVAGLEFLEPLRQALGESVLVPKVVSVWEAVLHVVKV
ncbi:MAG: CvpA family protein [Clostridia bacterium]|nr:CvpA family protein [Clostridia bacterium]